MNSTSGLFYKSLGLTKISNSKYSILIFFDVSILENQEQIISNYYSKSLGLCATTSRSNFHTNYCSEQLRILQSKITRLTDNLEILNHHSRHRRGILNGVSYPIKWLFGIPDSDDAQFYSSSIDELISDQRQTHTLMQQQVHVITDTIRNFNNSVQALSMTEQSLNENILRFNKFSNDITDHVLLDDIEIQILDHMLSLVQLVDESLELSDQILLGITLIRHGIISYHILQPKILMDELNLISQKFTLPLPITYSNLEIYYKIVKVKSFFQNKKLVIKIEVPITNIPSDFEIFQIIPLPTPHGNNSQLFSYIEPNSPYILFSKPRTQFAMLKNLAKCREFKPKEWLCEDISTMEKKNQNSCEISLFMPITEIPKTCKTRTIHADIEVFQNTNPNEWIYVVSKPTNMVILCPNNQDHEVLLNRIGTITIDSKCKAYTDTTTLEPISKLENITTNVKIPITDITEDDCCSKKANNKTLEALQMTPVKLSNIDFTELNYAQHRLTQFDEILQQQLNRPFIIKYQNWFTSTIIFIASIFGLLVLYKIFKWFNFLKYFYKLCFRSKTTNKSESASCTNLFHQCFISTRDSSNMVNYQSRDNPMELVPAPNLDIVSAPPPYNEPRRSMRLSSERSIKTRRTQRETIFNLE